MKFRLLVEFVTQTKEKFQKSKLFIFQLLQNREEAHWTKLNQILYTYSVGPLKARNAKTNHPKWGGGSKIKILALWTNELPHSLQKAEKSQPKHSVKKQAKLVKVVKSSVQSN